MNENADLRVFSGGVSKRSGENMMDASGNVGCDGEALERFERRSRSL